MKTFILLFLLICSVSTINLSPETWNKERIHEWLESLGLINYKDVFEKKNITTGFQLKYIDQNILDSDFPELSNLDKKTLLNEIEGLFKIKEEDIPKGIWKAFKINPSATTFVFNLFNTSPRLTYILIYYINPSIISTVFQEDNTYFDIRMILFPELLMGYKVISLYYSSHPYFSIIYCIFSLISVIFLITGFNYGGYGKLSSNFLVTYGILCSISPSILLKLDIYSLGFLSHSCLYFTMGVVQGYFMYREEQNFKEE